MRRREFLGLVGGAAVWPSVAPAQQGDQRLRRVAVFMDLNSNDTQGKERLGAFEKGLGELGWISGRNLRVDTRWSSGDPDQRQIDATDIVRTSPEVILTSATPQTRAVQRETRAIPIVFTLVLDPVGAGFVDSLARPGRNLTGFSNFEPVMAGKWLDILKEINPELRRVGVLRDAEMSASVIQVTAIQAAASVLGVDVFPVEVRDQNEVGRTFTQATRDTGLIVTSGPSATAQRGLIIALAAQHRIPVVYSGRHHVGDGGLISYGPNFVDLFRGPAKYVDRILKGERPSDLPVQLPTRLDLAINLVTARALGLTIPPSLLARADEVIE